jgi:ISXO2-like transposase domain
VGEKEPVVAAVEVRGAGSGRLRMQVIEDASGPNLTGFVAATVSPGAVVHTDGWSGYLGWPGWGTTTGH